MSFIAPGPGTQSRVLRHMRHMRPPNKDLPLGKFLAKRLGGAESPPKYVQPHDRIPYWNIVPGDEVVVRRGYAIKRRREDGTMERVRFQGIVRSIDRERNLAYLTGPEDPADDTLVPKLKKQMQPMLMDRNDPKKGFTPNVMFVPRPIHYSNLQLKLPQDIELPKDANLDLKAGVIASRIHRGKVAYNRQGGYYVWKRFATIKTPKGRLEVEVPWKKGERKPPTKQPYATAGHRVDEETWIPWQPTDPIFLLPGKRRTSPQAIERYIAQLKLRGRDPSGAPLKAREGKATSAPVPGSTATGLAPNGLKYEAAHSKKKTVKPPPVPQPPTAAEQVWQARNEASEWALDLQEQMRQAETNDESIVGMSFETPENFFSGLDYLDIAPHEGPTSEGWLALPPLPDRDTVALAPAEAARQRLDRIQRAVQTGRFAPFFSSANTGESGVPGFSKHEADAWPIELLMKNDLMNEQGSKHRRRRWHAKQVQLKEARRLEEMEEKENLAALRALKL